MKIKITIRKALNTGDFDKFCEITGIDPYCMNEGTATGEEELELTLEQAKDCQLI